MRSLSLPAVALVSLAAVAAEPVGPREPFAKAHVSMMARSETSGSREAQLSELDVWAEGAQLRARVHGDAGKGELWIGGLSAEPLFIEAGQIKEPRRHSLEAALKTAFSASPSLANANTDRVAGHPCKVINQVLPGGVSLTRCFWRGLPLSIELKARGFRFDAAATMVDEDAVTVADLQPPLGAPAAPASLSAGR